MKSFKQHLTEGSHDFKDFKDPWAVMSPEDRKEANRLTILIMKVMAGSPRQKELQAKRNAILAKYKIGQRKESITEAKKQVKWMRPKIATLKQEYEIEYKKHLVHELDKDVFPTVESFLKAAKEGIVRTITKGHDYYIANRSHTKNMKELLNLIKTYRSYPQYRNEDTLNAMKEAMLSGKPMDMPIIVRPTAESEKEIKEIASGHRDRIFAGNTRMDMAFMHGIEPKVLIIFLPKGSGL